MNFSGDFTPFNSPGRGFGKDLDKLREPLSEAAKKSNTGGGDVATGSSAVEVVRMLVMRLVQFDRALPDDHEACLRIFTPGAALDITVDDVTPLGAGLVVFSGVGADGGPLELGQSVSLLSYALFGRKRPQPESPKTPKRFHSRHADLFEKLASREPAGAAPDEPAAESGKIDP